MNYLVWNRYHFLWITARWWTMSYPMGMLNTFLCWVINLAVRNLSSDVYFATCSRCLFLYLHRSQLYVRVLLIFLRIWDWLYFHNNLIITIFRHEYVIWTWMSICCWLDIKLENISQLFSELLSRYKVGLKHLFFSFLMLFLYYEVNKVMFKLL